MPRLPFLGELLPGEMLPGIVLVEFDPQSLWYESSFTLTAHALREGVQTQYHTFTHLPSEVEKSLVQMGIDVNRFGEQGLFEILDSYTVTTGLGHAGATKPWWTTFAPGQKSWGEHVDARIQNYRNRGPDVRTKIHIDDNMSVLIEHGSEAEIVTHHRRKIIPVTREGNEIFVNAIMLGVGSESFVKQLESISDVIIELKSEEARGEIEHFARARTYRGRSLDSRWRKLVLKDSGEAVFVGPPNVKGLGEVSVQSSGSLIGTFPDKSEPKDEPLHLDLLNRLVPSGLHYGTCYLVEFESSSMWYDASLTLAADALRRGVRTDYHTFTHLASEIRERIAALGVDVRGAEENDTFRIWDSYTVQTGVERAEKVGRRFPREKINIRSLKLSDWEQQHRQELKGRLATVDTHRLHIDDDTSVLVRYNSEEEFLDYWRRISAPLSRRTQRIVIHSAVAGVHSEKFYRQLESFCDGVLDFVAQEGENRIEQAVRVRMMTGKHFDSQWKRLRRLQNGAVVIDDDQVSQTGTLQMPVEEKFEKSSEFEFESERSGVIFRQLVSDFLRDYMVSNYMQDKSGWRSIVDIAHETGIPVSSLYSRGRNVMTPFSELLKRGMIEMKLAPGERGRGGKVTRVRVAYEKTPVKDYVNRLARSVAKIERK